MRIIHSLSILFLRTVLLPSLVCIIVICACKSQTSTSTLCPDIDNSISGQLSEEEALGNSSTNLSEYIQAHYEKREVRIPMRDGISLFTAIYMPKNRSKTYPIMIYRTPYSVKPYGEDAFPNKLGPSPLFVQDGFIFVYQDVRGQFMSDGEFVNMRPHIAHKQGASDIDESTDTYDTIAWLLENVEGHNGRVGMWGISYPGFYAAAGMINAHPALKAVSPQAPIADWFFDDFYHHGAFFLPHWFNFFSRFGQAQVGRTTEWPPAFDHGTQDGYQFFLDVGPLKNLDINYLQQKVAFWTEIRQHPNRDEFWQQRDILPHLNQVAPAVMTVGGLFDAEDLYGPLQIYRSIEAKNPKIFNILVMGPWSHGGWERTKGDQLGNILFDAETSAYYQKDVEFVFFRYFLKEQKNPSSHDSIGLRLPEALIFETGINRWRSFDTWPPAKRSPQVFYLAEKSQLISSVPTKNQSRHDSFVSDPSKPVPYSETIHIGMTKEYMTDDQRFAARRPDVLIYQSEVLTADLTIAGPVNADLWVSTSQGDADWVVKLIDVFPASMPGDKERSENMQRPLGGYQMMVRSEILRGRFRDSYEHPRPFVSGKPTRVQIPLQDVLHTFKAGHRVMIQIQSTWFPLVDRNPQKYVDNIFMADDEDFVTATHKVYHSPQFPSRIEFSTLASEDIDGHGRN